MRSKADAYMGSLIFGEESTEELEQYRDGLKEEIANLEEAVEALDVRERKIFGNIGRPEILKALEEKIVKAEGLKGALEVEIADLIEGKKEQIEAGIKELAAKTQKRKDTYIALTKKLKIEAKESHKELKSSKRELKAWLDANEQRQLHLIAAVNELEKERSAVLNELTELKKEIEVKTEALDLRASHLSQFEKNLKGKEVGLEGREGEFKTRIDEVERKVGVEMAFIHKEKIRLDGLAKTLEERDTSLEGKMKTTAGLQESLATEREEMRVWSKKLEERAAKVSQREEDLDKNWTSFVRESGQGQLRH
jgi:chromosome segregation ATPase